MSPEAQKKPVVACRVKEEMCLALYFSTFLFDACTIVFYRQINDYYYYIYI